MPRQLHHALTDNNIERARAVRRKAGLNADTYTLVDGNKLYLEVDHRKKVGSHIWRAYLTVNGKETKATYGRYPQVDIETARRNHEADVTALARMPHGQQVNPATVRQKALAEAQAAEALAIENARRSAEGETILGTFKDFAEQVYAQDAAGWKLDYAAEYARVMAKSVYPIIGAMPIAQVTSLHIADICKGVISKKTKLSTKGNLHAQQKVRRFLKAVFDEAFDQGVITAIPITEPRRAKKVALPAPTERAAVTTLPLLGRLVRSVMMESKPSRFIARDAFFLTLATGQRRETIINARWEDIKWEYAEWHIPRWTVGTEAAREQHNVIEAEMARIRVRGAMKGKLLDPNNAPHVVPLSRQVMEMLQALLARQIEANELDIFVFPSRSVKNKGIRGMSETLISEMLNDGQWKGKHTLHGCRTSFRTIMPSVLGDHFEIDGKFFDTHLACEVQIDHTHGAAMQKATANMPGTYYRGDMLEARRHLAQRWSDLIERLANETPAEESGYMRLAPEQAAALAALKRPLQLA
jgi:integrase